MRRLLVVYGTALVSAVLVAFLVPLGLLASSLAHDRAIETARQEAQGLVVLANNASRTRLQDAVAAVNTGPRRTTVFLPDGTELGARIPRTPSVQLASRGRAFTATTAGGVEVLVPVGGPDGVAVIRTFVPDSLLTAGVWRAWITLVVVGLILLALAILVGDRIARRLSRSVTDLADVAERVGAGDLSATVAPAGPREVRSVGRVLNGLGSRIARMLDDERELSADLSHRLRTPVTALRLDVDGLADADERARMTEHVDALVDAVDAAVRAARHPSHLGVPASCDAVAVAAERAAFWQVSADATSRALHLDLPPGPREVRVSAADLGAALDALVDNVFSHTAAGTGFTIRVRPEADGSTLLEVSDYGVGPLPDQATERGRSGAGSTGLGLDVVRRTATSGGGGMDVGRSPTGGTSVSLTFPPATLSES